MNYFTKSAELRMLNFKLLEIQHIKLLLDDQDKFDVTHGKCLLLNSSHAHFSVLELITCGMSSFPGTCDHMVAS